MINCYKLTKNLRFKHSIYIFIYANPEKMHNRHLLILPHVETIPYHVILAGTLLLL